MSRSVDQSINQSFSRLKSREKTRFGKLPATISLSIREPGSAITHFAGLLLVLEGAGPLLMRTYEHGSRAAMAGMILFLLSAVLLYSASTLYHTVVLDEHRTTIFRKLDHLSIPVLIAGSYTPFCLTILRDGSGIPLCILVWALALAGMVFKLAWITCPKWVSSVIYIAMGWVCLPSCRPILQRLGGAGFAWLLAGGLFYSFGAAIYAAHPKKFDEKHLYFGSHEIFHVMIMLGTLCHYIVLYRWIAVFT